MRPCRIAANYRALIRRAAGPSDSTLLHLIREDAETSLCGIPRAQLSGGSRSDELVCPECIEWLPKRLEFSKQHPRVKPS